jgi:NAD(P)-dependent dehydrogenase (short-subunit alcohol dehydrogenase family)
MMTILQGRVAVITGAASGIGQALAENLSAHGCHLALVDVDEEGLQVTAMFDLFARASPELTNWLITRFHKRLAFL